MRETSNIGSGIFKRSKRITAGVLTALMVVTSVPTTGFGALEAKAAADTVTVYRSYNEASGEHLYTTDAGEHQFVVQSGRVDEKEAWVAPVKSNTEVYRSYNPTSGEHLLVPKSEAEGLVAFGWNNEGLKMYSDDEKGVAIYRVFNPNAPEQGPGCAGSHHYTASKGEAEALVAAGWKWDNNGEPVLYGVDVNAAVAIESVALDNTTPKVGDTITAKTTPSNVKDVTFVWSINGKEVSGETKDSFKVPDGAKAGDKIKVAATANGKTVESKEAEVTAKAEEDVSAEVTIFDASGLQSDGTGLVSDELRVSYGSAMGIPRTITWYYNEKVVKAFNSQAGNLTDALVLYTAGHAKINNVEVAQSECKDGKYYAVIISEDGKSFKSNTIDLVYEEQAANMSSVTITDDLSKSDNVAFAAKDTKAVFTVVMDKAYEGDFYVYEEKTTGYTSNNKVATKIAFDPKAMGAWSEQTSASKMTEKNAIEAANKRIVYIADDGKATFMFVTDAPDLKRGSSYKVVFDQKSLTEDTISTTMNKNANASKAAKVPYLPAPTKIELQTVAKGNPIKVNLLDKDGNVLEYYGNETNTAGFETFKIFGSESAEKGTSTVATGGVDKIKGGVFTTGNPLATDDGNTYYVAEAKTTEGVFAEKAVTLTSDFKQVSTAIATSVELEEDGTTPTSAKIKLKGLVEDAKVYVVNKTATGDSRAADEFDKDSPNTYINSVEVKRASSEVIVPSVFTKDDIKSGDEFVAYVVPANDDSIFSQKVSDEVTIKQVATSLEYVEGATSYTGAVGTAKIAVGNALVKDQFDQKIDGTIENGFDAVAGKTATVAINNAGGKEESMKATYDISADGKLTINLESSDPVNIGDGFDITVLGTKFNLEAQRPAALVAADDYSSVLTKPFTIKMGSEELLPGEILTGGTYASSPAIATTNAYDAAKALEKAKDKKNAVVINVTYTDGTAGATADTDYLNGTYTVGKNVAFTMGAATLLTGNITVEADGKLDTSTNKLTVNGTITNNGTINGGYLDVKATGKIYQNKTATLAGGANTTFDPASKFYIGKGSTTNIGTGNTADYVFLASEEANASTASIVGPGSSDTFALTWGSTRTSGAQSAGASVAMNIKSGDKLTLATSFATLTATAP